MPSWRKRRFARDEAGRFHPNLAAEEGELLVELAGQAVPFLDGDDPSAARLYPVAFPEDPEAEADFRALIGTSLRDVHAGALDVIAATAGAETIDEEQLGQWMGAIETMRLVLGTSLGIEQDIEHIDPGDPLAPQYALYAYLTVLQAEVVDALVGTLPETEDGP
ncbi:MAG: DUF2017 family protein [Acidimicrobiales bacterium]